MKHWFLLVCTLFSLGYGKWGNIDSCNVLHKLRLKMPLQSRLLYVNPNDSLLDTTNIFVTPYSYETYFPSDIYLWSSSSGIWGANSSSQHWLGYPDADSSAYFAWGGLNSVYAGSYSLIAANSGGVGYYNATVHDYRWTANDSLRFRLQPITGGGVRLGDCASPYINHPVSYHGGWSTNGLDYALAFAEDTANITSKLNTTAGLSFSDTSRIMWRKILPDTAILSVGSDSGDDWHDIDSCQNGIYTIVEAAASPAIVFEVRFTGVEAFNGFIHHVGYSGGTSHAVSIQLYNWNSTTWDCFGSVQHTYVDTTAGQRTLSAQNYQCIHPDRYIDGSGNVYARFYHGASGVASHRLYVDYFGLYQ